VTPIDFTTDNLKNGSFEELAGNRSSHLPQAPHIALDGLLNVIQTPAVQGL
jgi:hypothetical protein